MDTIFALSTAPGRAGVAVMRVSGPAVARVANRLMSSMPAPRRAAVRVISDGDDAIDEALVLYFPMGESFTGEEVLELHLHGSPAVVSRVSSILSEIDDVRAAEAGEFTRRAMENGRLDLAEVEGLADLIDAETEAQRRQALVVMRGGLTEKVESWRHDLLRAAALIEATIDFADEEVPVDVSPEVSELLERLKESLKGEIAAAHVAERIRDGFEVAILGRPNVGKSTLLNRIAGRDVAITSEIAGTTRDVIEVRTDLGGLPVTFLDTAGLRETEDVVESVGVDWARKRAAEADLRVILLEEDVSEIEDMAVTVKPQDIVRFGKADIPGRSTGVSGKSGEGLSELLDEIKSRLEPKLQIGATAIRERQRRAVEQALASIDRASVALDNDENSELIALEIRDALYALDNLIGRVGVEDILGEIFSSFCIGK
ncbi:tRNA uridine-5-carboxymethylaminomethyl(34) synthesis GTPase MnmE [Paracoccaceae bacterium GXU_MW_L88]